MKRCLCIAVSFCAVVVDAVPADEQLWTTGSFLDFSDGTVVDGGVNTYVAANGTIRLINLWDLNHDGNFDLPVACGQDHDERVELYVYWADENGFAPDRRSLLPTEGAISATAADLDGDGYPELVVANRFDGEKTNLDAYIYEGSQDGFDISRRTSLPAKAATGVDIGDLDRDGYRDIVIANQGVDYHMKVDRYRKSFIYWGSENGYSSERRSTLQTINCADVKIADINHDGHLDILFANEGNVESESGVLIYLGDDSGRYSADRRIELPGVHTSTVEVADLDADGHDEIVVANLYRLKGKLVPPTGNVVETYRVNSYVYHGSPDGYSVQRRTELPTIGARGVAIGDLNGDHRPDLVFANSAEGVSFIYWNGPRGFSAHRRSQVLAPDAWDCAITDFDRDGHPDLILANHAHGGSFDTVSYIYRGGTDGFRDDRRIELPTSGASKIVTADLNSDQLEDVVFVNKIEGVSSGGGTTSTAVPGQTTSWIYWGDHQGRYTVGRRIGLPTVRGAGSFINSDLDCDGYVDLLFPQGFGRTTIFRGTSEGISPKNSEPVAGGGSGGGRAADFNRDGYLDVFLNSAVLYGQKSGFSKVNRFVFEPAVHYPIVADLNGDGWLDVGAPNHERMTIFFNGPGGFDAGDRTVIEHPGKEGRKAEVADFNDDGFLDIVIVKETDRFKPIGPGEASVHHANPNTESSIYWGSAEGYSPSRRYDLPTVGSIGVGAADYNADGHLDLFFSSYIAGIHRHYPGVLYWNSAEGFDPQRRTMIPGFSGCGTFAADCDLDGYPELVVANHTRVGDHRSDVWVFRGRPDGYKLADRDSLPATGPHFFSLVDVGNVYDRSGRYDYISPPFDAGSGAVFESISWEAKTPFRTGVEFQLRTARSKDKLQSSPWEGPRGDESLYTTSGTTIPPVPPHHHWIQYRATLISPNSANTPVLESVSVAYRQLP